MYALLFPVLAPFVLLAMLMGLSWWEDHLLPSATPQEAAAEPVRAPAVLVPDREPARIAVALTGQGARS
ncbi:hypothetical protein [Streptomyces sp. WM6378]|uniref:hypothetical protein n=1 Tax=Streptomyces sp. WM6378 TaxID=1415557 RepID=UPI0006AF68D4|nr:hypothetical protein [Streptomyces sp. WM6378]KOU47570.1 hypothetical protein ADK54_13375 [Streptomyces sp. WM6378]